jgi:hypothetical protein
VAEIRTTSSTGGQKGVKPQRHDLLPRQALDMIAEVYAFGAEKYADHNWRHGYEWGKSYAALQRHITAFWDGETVDEESGLNHLAHAGFHIFALLTWFAEQGEGVENPFDDRWPHALERARLAKEAEDLKAAPETMWVIPNAKFVDMGTIADEGFTMTFEATTIENNDAMRLLFGLPVDEPARFVAGPPEETVDLEIRVSEDFDARQVAEDISAELARLNEYHNRA